MTDYYYISMDETFLSRMAWSRSTTLRQNERRIISARLLKLASARLHGSMHEIDAMMRFYMSSPSEEELRAFVKNMEAGTPWTGGIDVYELAVRPELVC